MQADRQGHAGSHARTFRQKGKDLQGVRQTQLVWLGHPGRVRNVDRLENAAKQSQQSSRANSLVGHEEGLDMELDDDRQLNQDMQPAKHRQSVQVKHKLSGQIKQPGQVKQPVQDSQQMQADKDRQSG